MPKRKIKKDFDLIIKGSHYRNWAPDWFLVVDIYEKFPNSFSILTPFAFSYLEELIRSMTSEYGISVFDDNGKPKRRQVGKNLFALSKKENKKNIGLIRLLNRANVYFESSLPSQGGKNRNNVQHGYLHSRFWIQDDFEELIHLIALLSKYSGM